LAVTAALQARAGSGQGQFIDVSLLESGVSLAVWEAGRYFAAGEVAQAAGSAHQSLAPYQVFPTSDGFITIGAVTPRTWDSFCHVLDLEVLLSDARFTDASVRFANRADLLALLDPVIRQRTTPDLIQDLEAAGVPCAAIADYGDVFSDPQLRSRDYFWRAEHPTAGSVDHLGSPMRLTGTPVRRDTAGPRLGEDTVSLLGAVGYRREEIIELLELGIVASTGVGVA
jgi:formyl-CoA transferase